MRRKKKLFIVLGIVQVFIALGAFPAGILFLLEPDGSMMGMDLSLLGDAPFSDYTIPALFLLIVLGIGNALAALFSFLYLDLSGKAGIALGLVLMTWIGIQMYWMGYTSFLQPVMGVMGSVELYFGYSVMRYIKKAFSIN